MKIESIERKYGHPGNQHRRRSTDLAIPTRRIMTQEDISRSALRLVERRATIMGPIERFSSMGRTHPLHTDQSDDFGPGAPDIYSPYAVNRRTPIRHLSSHPHPSDASYLADTIYLVAALSVGAVLWFSTL